MTLDELLVILQNKMFTLQETRKLAVNSGSLAQVLSIDADLSTTELTIQQIKDKIAADA